MLRVKCRCGKVLKVGPSAAGKKLACPQCRRPFRIPAERFASAGVSVAAPAAAPAPAPVELDLQPAELDLEGLSEGQAVATAAPAPRVVEIDEGPMDYAAAGAARAPGYPRPGRDAVSGPRHGYWENAFASFIYPVHGVENALGFFAICVIVSLPEIVGMFISFIGALLGFLIFFWLPALYLSVVQDTAAGSDDLPSVRMEHGVIDDFIKPTLRYLGSFAVVMAPAVALIIIRAAGGLPASTGTAIPFLMAIGAFFWPIVMLLFSVNALDKVLRVDLILVTVSRTFLPYLATWLMLLLVGLVFALTSAGTLIVAFLGLKLPTWLQTGGGLALTIAFRILEIYIWLVAMRLIGLYYLHFKRRFAFELE